MAFTRFNSAEGGSNSTTVTTANSGGASGYAFDSATGTVTYSSTVAQSGSLSYQCVTAGTPYNQWTVPNLSTIWMRSWIYFTSLVTTNTWLHSVASSGGITNLSFLHSDGKIGNDNNGNVNYGTYTYAVNTWYRVETDMWSSATQCQMITKTYDNSGNPLETITSGVSTCSFGTTIKAWFCGGGGITLYMDNLAVSDQGWIGSSTSFTLAKLNTAEGQASGTTLTVANSGGGSGDAADAIAGTQTFDNTYAQSGSLSYKYANASSYGRWILPGTLSTVYAETYIYLTSLAATQSAPLYVYGDSSAHTADIAYLPATGHWQVALSGATIVQGTHTPSTGQWYRLEASLTFGATTAQMTARVYDSNGNLAETITTVANGTMTVPQYIEFGQIAAYTPSYWLDNLAVSDQGWVGGSQSVAGAAAVSVSTAPAGTVGVTVPGAGAASATASPAGAVTGTAVVAGAAAASGSAALAGAVTVTVTGAVAPVASTSPAGSVTASVTVTGAVAASASAAPAGTITGAGVVTGTVASSASTAPAGTVTWSSSITGTVAASAAVAPAGSVTAAAATPGAVAASSSSAPAGLTSITVPGPVAAAVSAAPAGVVAVTIPGAVAVSISIAGAGAFAGAGTFTGTVAASLSIAPAGSVTWDLNIHGAAAHSTSIAPAGTVFSVQKPIQLTAGAARSTWTTGAARSTWTTGRGRLT